MKYLKIFIWLLFLGYSIDAYSTHLAGGSLTYKCLGQNTYEVTFTMITDCIGNNSGLDVDQALYGYSNSCSFERQQIGTLHFISQEEDNSCNRLEGLTTCSNQANPIPGYLRTTYRGTIELPLQCNDWVIYIHTSQRNQSSIIPNDVIRLEAGINNTSGICNNSVEFTGDHVIRACVDYGIDFPVTTVESDGDNVLIANVCPKSSPLNVFPLDPDNPVNYPTPYSCTNPVSSSIPFQMSGNTFSFFPNLQMISGTAFRADEWRNGINVGWATLETQIVVSPNCYNLAPDIQEINHIDYEITVNQEESFCMNIEIDSYDGDQITSIVPDLSNLPGATYTITPIPTPDSPNQQLLQICWTEVGSECEYQSYTFSVQATDNGCPSPATSEQEFTINVLPNGSYCPWDFIITNRNPTNGLQVPVLTKAENDIWVGDNIPIPPYNPINDPPQGIVEINYPVHMQAGHEVYLGPCQSGSQGQNTYGDCIILNPGAGNEIHIEIKENNCDSDCPVDPLDISAQAIFSCGDERLVSSVSGGVPPYTYIWNVGGNELYNNINDGTVDIHDIISDISYDGSTVLWSVQIYDAVGQTGFVNGYMYGTYRFYQDLSNNQTWVNPTSNHDPPAGYHYMTETIVDSYAPFDIRDGVNITPPYYGAVGYYLRIWPEWNITYNVVEETRSLDYEAPSSQYNGTIDWSLDNGEVYWNGHRNNDLNLPCVLTDIFNYVVSFWNCVDYYYLLHDVYATGDCYETDVNGWIISAMASNSDSLNLENNLSIINSNGEDSNSSDSLRLLRNDNIENNFSIHPNPNDGIFKLNGDHSVISNIEIIDSYGKVVKEFIQNTTEFDIREFEAGIYYLKINSSKDFQIFKIVKK
ncbi:MAG: T9SS type A sorting domain-containing protein [Crocinitomicaceae bacterium]